MAFDFSFDDLMDSEGDGVLPSNFSKSVIDQHNADGSPTETTRSSSQSANLAFNVFSWSNLLQGGPIFGEGADVLKVFNNYTSSLLAGTIGIGGNKEGTLGGGFDNLLPDDIKSQAAKYRGKIGKDVGKTADAPPPAAAPASPAPADPNAPPAEPTPGGATGNGNTAMIWPCKGTVSQEFGVGGHPGMDIFNALGTPIYAVLDGVVTDTNANGQQNPGGYGNHWLYIKHRDDLYTLYGHVQDRLVNPGDTVTQGQVIHHMGSEGASTGSHLHFETRTGPYGGWGNLSNPNIKNPREYLPPGPPPST